MYFQLAAVEVLNTHSMHTYDRYNCYSGSRFAADPVGTDAFEHESISAVGGGGSF